MAPSAHDLVGLYTRLTATVDPLLKDLPALQPVWLMVGGPEDFSARASDVLDQRVTDIEAKHEGWLRRQSAAYRTPLREARQPERDGLPLYGEWAVSEEQSLHLLQAATGGWRLLTLTELGSAGAEAVACLRERTTLLGGGDAARLMLVYHVFWGVPAGGTLGVLRRIAVRFVGFER